MNVRKTIFQLIASPKAAWEEVGKFSIPKELLLSKTLYPMLAILALSLLVKFFTISDLTLTDFLNSVITDVCKYFFGYMLSAAILMAIYRIKDEAKQNKLYVFIIYNYCVMMLFNIIINAIPLEIPILELYPLYSVFIIMRGFNYFSFAREEEVKFVIFFSVVIILPPLLLQSLLKMLF